MRAPLAELWDGYWDDFDASWQKEADNPQNKANPCYLEAMVEYVDQHRTRPSAMT